MVRTTTPLPMLRGIDQAGETLRAMRWACTNHHEFADPKMERELTAAIGTLMRFRLKLTQRAGGAA